MKFLKDLKVFANYLHYSYYVDSILLLFYWFVDFRIQGNLYNNRNVFIVCSKIVSMEIYQNLTMRKSKNIILLNVLFWFNFECIRLLNRSAWNMTLWFKLMSLWSLDIISLSSDTIHGCRIKLDHPIKLKSGLGRNSKVADRVGLLVTDDFFKKHIMINI